MNFLFYNEGLGDQAADDRAASLRAQYPDYVFAGSRLRYANRATIPWSYALRDQAAYKALKDALAGDANFSDISVYGKSLPSRVYVELVSTIDRASINDVRGNIEQVMSDQGWSFDQDPANRTIGVVAQSDAAGSQATATALPPNVPAVARFKGDGKNADGSDRTPPDKPKNSFLDSLAKGLGISVPFAGAGLLILAVIVLKK